MQQLAQFLKTKASIIAIVAGFLAVTTAATAYAAQTKTTVDETENVSVSQADITPLKRPCYGYGCDTQAPFVHIVLPATNWTGKVRISAIASDNVKVRQVNFYIDGRLLAIDRNAPYNATINARSLNPGWHYISAVAYDTNGNSSVDSVYVLTGNTPCYGYGCPIKPPKR